MHAKKTNKTKVLAVVLALVLVIGCAAGATLAWLTDKTDPVKNTFTYGDINIDLKEHELLANGTLGSELVTENDNYKMVPGNVLPKDPFVTVVKDSEACWLFVKIEKSANFGDFMTFTVADGWTAVPGVGGVYYREVTANDADQIFYVLAGDDDNANGIVTVKEDVTKAMLNALDAGEGAANYPTLTFTAYAVQKEAADNAADAWAETGA